MALSHTTFESVFELSTLDDSEWFMTMGLKRVIFQADPSVVWVIPTDGVADLIIEAILSRASQSYVVF